MEAGEFLRELNRGSGIAVFGTGHIAGVLHRALLRHGLEDTVRLYVVSGKPAKHEFCGKPVISLAEYAKGAEWSERQVIRCKAIGAADDHMRCGEERLPLYLAVHASILREVEEALAGAGVPGRWIAPVIPALLYGAPLQSQVMLPVKELLERADSSLYWIAARYCAVDGIVRGDETALQVYRKTVSLIASPATVEKRLRHLRALIDAVRERGFDPARPILVDGDMRLIDGAHRLALAFYLGEERISCRVYPRSEIYDSVMDVHTLLPREVFSEAGFTGQERDMLLSCGNRLMQKPEISVILPVYNVKEYIGQCMESLQAQTFHFFEVIVIDDGSTDGSGGLCDREAEKDSRVRVIHQENRGVSAARNRGILAARGTWLAFVDPDDWVEPVYLERLYETAVMTGADIVECDVLRYHNGTERSSYRACGGTMGIDWTREEHMKYGSTASYKMISRRTLWTEHGVRFPDCAFESPAVYALILALAKKVVNIPEALYHYRIFRPDSLIETGYAGKDGTPNNTLGIEAMEHLTDEFRRLGLYDAYSETLEGVVTYRLSDILATQFHRKSEDDFRETAANFRRFLERVYPGGRNRPYVCFGGFNLNRILVHMNRLQDPWCRFNFSSLISLTDEAAKAQSIRHGNRYREIMLRREEAQSLWDVLRDVQPAYFFMDLMEERFDILERAGRYVTLSDAREGAAGAGLPADAKRIPRTDAACAALFAERCPVFVNRIREIVPGIRFVVVETLLCEEKGTPGNLRPYENQAEIRRINAVLKAQYDVLRTCCPDAVWIAPDTLPELAGWLFTDEKYGYGAVPSHINEIANRKIAQAIEAALAGVFRRRSDAQ